jgi:type VI secretion system protein ImpK
MSATSQAPGYQPIPRTPQNNVAIPAENLPLLYQGMLTSIVRLQAGRQHITDGESFRKRMKSTMDEVDRIALAYGYDPLDTTDARFAVVAFLDEVVLNSSDPAHDDWQRRTLQEELFGQNDAGVVFFEKLEQFCQRRSSHSLADVLEVYLSCVLLGFHGRYTGPGKYGLDSWTARLTKRIEDIRGVAGPLSPRGIPEPAVVAQSAPVHAPARFDFRILVLAGCGITLMLFLAFYWNLSLAGDSVLKVLANGR